MKKYTTVEVMAMLERDESLKFQAKSFNGFPKILSINDERWVKCKQGERDILFSLEDEWTSVQEPVNFITAVNSGKNIVPVSLMGEKHYHPYVYWLGYMVSSISSKGKPIDLINDLWYVED